MAEASIAAQPVPNIRVLPQHTRATRAMCGSFGAIGSRKEEVRILLNSFGITANQFDETIAGTRLNTHLLQRVSDYFMGCTTFRNEKVKLDTLTVEGDAAQLIKSLPTDENVDENARWTNLIVRPNSANANSISTFGATYLMGYQLYIYCLHTLFTHTFIHIYCFIFNRNINYITGTIRKRTIFQLTLSPK